jgi:methionine sulfoxide reductase catalytic subunit
VNVNDYSGRELRAEVTPRQHYLTRRRFLKAAGLVATASGTAAAYRAFNPVHRMELTTAALGESANDMTEEQRRAAGYLVDEPWTAESSVISYNNFYEFTTDKNAVAMAARGFTTQDWSIEIGGLVEKPRVLSMDELMRSGPLEERIYRMRCVEAWSMVIPWSGIQLSHVLEAARPSAKAKYVAFETLYDPERMPGQKTDVLEWPYVEGLRLDEAMHPLTILAVGLYGRALPPQDGAPVRLVVPWKYGFKGIKSIVKITLTDQQPPTSWNRYAPREYGFLANVNPRVAHPRWSQATEQRIGEAGRRPTLLFNGYEQHVASLYDGLDLAVHF